MSHFRFKPLMHNLIWLPNSPCITAIDLFHNTSYIWYFLFLVKKDIFVFLMCEFLHILTKSRIIYFVFITVQVSTICYILRKLFRYCQIAGCTKPCHPRSSKFSSLHSSLHSIVEICVVWFSKVLEISNIPVLHVI